MRKRLKVSTGRRLHARTASNDLTLAAVKVQKVSGTVTRAKGEHVSPLGCKTGAYCSS
jgi:hypothetical protein